MSYKKCVKIMLKFKFIFSLFQKSKNPLFMVLSEIQKLNSLNINVLIFKKSVPSLQCQTETTTPSDRAEFLITHTQKYLHSFRELLKLPSVQSGIVSDLLKINLR